MVILGFVFIGALVVAALLTPILGLYLLTTKFNHPLDEEARDDYAAVPVLHPEFHQQLRGIERG